MSKVKTPLEETAKELKQRRNAAEDRGDWDEAADWEAQLDSVRAELEDFDRPTVTRSKNVLAATKAQPIGTREELGALRRRISSAADGKIGKAAELLRTMRTEFCPTTDSRHSARTSRARCTCCVKTKRSAS
jgi:hypothetical protein